MDQWTNPVPGVEVSLLCEVVVPHDDPISSGHLLILDLTHMSWNPQLFEDGDDHLLADIDG